MRWRYESIVKFHFKQESNFRCICDVIVLSLCFQVDNHNPHSLENIVKWLTAGGFAGMLSWTITYPVDVVKSRLQADGAGGRPYKYRGMIDCGKQIYRTEGSRVFLRFVEVWIHLTSHSCSERSVYLICGRRTTANPTFRIRFNFRTAVVLKIGKETLVLTWLVRSYKWFRCEYQILTTDAFCWYVGKTSAVSICLNDLVVTWLNSVFCFLPSRNKIVSHS